jgi:hypothetical protein
LTGWEYHVSHDLNFSNRPVRTRMPGGVAGERSAMLTAPMPISFRRCPLCGVVAVRLSSGNVSFWPDLGPTPGSYITFL